MKTFNITYGVGCNELCNILIKAHSYEEAEAIAEERLLSELEDDKWFGVESVDE